MEKPEGFLNIKFYSASSFKAFTAASISSSVLNQEKENRTMPWSTVPMD